mmetsp:Transcript_24574/g.37365  ORF Transcript_24574/g.37365 Transcript_24574/m.37365 type:complete len:147 (-) Transcript_24574:12-452(-)
MKKLLETTKEELDARSKKLQQRQDQIDEVLQSLIHATHQSSSHVSSLEGRMDKLEKMLQILIQKVAPEAMPNIETKNVSSDASTNSTDEDSFSSSSTVSGLTTMTEPGNNKASKKVRLSPGFSFDVTTINEEAIDTLDPGNIRKQE